MSTLSQKIWISINPAIILMLLNLPITHAITGTIINGCPTMYGRLLHILLFILISYSSMNSFKEDKLKKLKYSIYGALIGFFIFSPEVQLFMNNFVRVIDNNCINGTGLIIHTVLYIICLVGVMYLPCK